MRFKTATAATVAATLTLAACSDDNGTTATTDTETTLAATTAPDDEATDTTAGDEQGDTIVDVIDGNNDLSTLSAAITTAKVDAFLSSDENGPLTVFAPTNAAFEAALENLGVTQDELLAKPDALVALLQYHTVRGELPSADLVNLGGTDVVTEWKSEPLSVTVEGESVMVNDAKVSQADLEASNGLVHIIDQVLVPADFDLNAFATDESMTDDTMTDDTMTDESMVDESTPETTVTEETDASTVPPTTADDGEMVDGDDADGDDADGDDADGDDGEMTDAEGDAGATAAIPPTPDGNLMMIAAANPDLTTFVQATGAADLYTPLAVDGVFTIFAPTNEAFEAALAELDMTAEELLADKALLTKVMNNHVVSGAVESNVITLLDGQNLPTIGGGDLSIAIDGDSVMVGDATVTEPDQRATNGVIHVIDTVLVP